ncbi:MAG: TsaB protein, required for threonylcarbamoyladenosine (t(6)A) formation in tRNA [uncultured Thiotrichaceae bacterium]|uniref:tRNA threonylcarbamoyladenosine biosynthesis protein TsaB n=1 Tax=uncultured Thiotrichaceae bacterium TaxID=298394 RepID=A0A6S6U283_9GAMM|nr:MAG: TsaB protein, required for threonylcarbamoyladenosine (t(6)A) formation in tRNA [uncultured Thiotrichaceae bacterium]
MTTILAIETATEACSAALLYNDAVIHEYEIAPRMHTRLILPMVEKLLAEAAITLADVDAIAFGRGPGAFTGLRIATGVTQGLALAHDTPVLPVSTLAAMALEMAEQHADKEHFLVAVDARINEVYWGHYKRQGNSVVLVEQEQVIAADKLAAITLENWLGVGTGWSAYEESFQALNQTAENDIYPEVYPSAKYIALLGNVAFEAGKALPAELAQPVYLRDKVADTIAERERAKKNA